MACIITTFLIGIAENEKGRNDNYIDPKCQRSTKSALRTSRELGHDLRIAIIHDTLKFQERLVNLTLVVRRIVSSRMLKSDPACHRRYADLGNGPLETAHTKCGKNVAERRHFENSFSC